MAQIASALTIFVFAGCSKPVESPPDAPAPPSSASVRPAIHTQNVCNVDSANGTAFLHAVLPVMWKGADAAESEERVLWSVHCNLKEGLCEGVRMDVKRVEDRQGEVRPLNLTVVRTMKLLSIQGSTAVLDWDGATITLDATAGRVRFTSSSKRGEGRGDVPCTGFVPTDFVTP